MNSNTISLRNSLTKFFWDFFFENFLGFQKSIFFLMVSGVDSHPLESIQTFFPTFFIGKSKIFSFFQFFTFFQKYFVRKNCCGHPKIRIFFIVSRDDFDPFESIQDLFQTFSDEKYSHFGLFFTFMKYFLFEIGYENPF